MATLTRKQKNFRLPDMTTNQIEFLSQAYGLTETQLIILAVDRFAREGGPEEVNNIDHHISIAKLYNENGPDQE
jgi:hypothetical protein